jgi:3-oxoacyl-[acyl-carrier protein] reductase
MFSLVHGFVQMLIVLLL